MDDSLLVEYNNLKKTEKETKSRLEDLKPKILGSFKHDSCVSGLQVKIALKEIKVVSSANMKGFVELAKKSIDEKIVFHNLTCSGKNLNALLALNDELSKFVETKEVESLSVKEL